MNPFSSPSGCVCWKKEKKKDKALMKTLRTEEETKFGEEFRNILPKMRDEDGER